MRIRRFRPITATALGLVLAGAAGGQTWTLGNHQVFTRK